MIETHNRFLEFLTPKSQGGYLPNYEPAKEYNSKPIKQVIGLKNNGSYTLQYNDVYVSRFQKLSEGFSDLCPHSVSQINGQAIISGIIKKKYKKLVRKIGSKKSAMPVQNQNYVEPFVLYGEDDLVQIEDQTGKIEIVFTQHTKVHHNSNTLSNQNLTLTELPHGIVVGIKGYLDFKTGKFVCRDVYFPQMIQFPQMSKLSMEEEVPNSSKNNIVVVSNLSGKDYDRLIQFYKYADQSIKQQNTILVLCGNLLISQAQGSAKYLIIDNYLDILSKIVKNIVVLPDNGNKSWPHEPLRSFFLPKSSKYVTLTHNPTILQIQDCRILITNGQNITQSHRVCSTVNPLDIMQSHLIYSHFAPYSPSSFKCRPLSSDSFALESLPQMYIVAKQSQYSTRLYKNNRGNCRLITVPSIEDGIISIDSKTLTASVIEEM